MNEVIDCKMYEVMIYFLKLCKTVQNVFHQIANNRILFFSRFLCQGHTHNPDNYILHL